MVSVILTTAASSRRSRPKRQNITGTDTEIRSLSIRLRSGHMKARHGAGYSELVIRGRAALRGRVQSETTTTL